jgi:uncharacterized membrane protein
VEYLVPFMPLFGALPLAAAAAFIAYAILRHRERMAGTNAELEQIRQELEALRANHLELQERLDFTERILAQVRDAQRGSLNAGQ